MKIAKAFSLKFALMSACISIFLGVFYRNIYLEAAQQVVQATCKSNQLTTIVVYSKDRPMQLYAFLESLYTYVKGDFEVVIIYAASSKEYLRGYAWVKNKFTNKIVWREQVSGSDFKPLTLSAVYESKGDFVIFAVDDIILTDFILVKEAIEFLKQEKAYTFRFTLGKNITYCYTQNKKAPQPSFQVVDAHKQVYSWFAHTGSTDWLYPHSLDLALYRKHDIKLALTTLSYENPNIFEARWAYAHPKREYKCLCYFNSKAVNVPINRVQTLNNNRHMKLFTTQELLSLFLKGYKIDIKPLRNIKNKSPHIEYEPKFIKY